MVTEYKLYCIGADGKIATRHDCESTTDESALNRARELRGGFSVDVWEGSRFVASIAKDGTVMPEQFFGRLD